MLDALQAGLAASELLRQARPRRLHGERSGEVPVKDLTFAVDSAAGRDLPSLAVSRRLFVELTEAGLGDLDNTVVLEHLRRSTGSDAA